MGKKKTTPSDYIKANRKGSREAEIENHMRPVHFNRVHKSKKAYDRNRQKADDQRHLPSSFFGVPKKRSKKELFTRINLLNRCARSLRTISGQ